MPLFTSVIFFHMREACQMPVNDPLKSGLIAADRTATLLVGQGGHESSLSVLFIADFQWQTSQKSTFLRSLRHFHWLLQRLFFHVCPSWQISRNAAFPLGFIFAGQNLKCCVRSDGNDVREEALKAGMGMNWSSLRGFAEHSSHKQQQSEMMQDQWRWRLQHVSVDVKTRYAVWLIKGATGDVDRVGVRLRRVLWMTVNQCMFWQVWSEDQSAVMCTEGSVCGKPDSRVAEGVKFRRYLCMQTCIWCHHSQAWGEWST